MKKILLFVLLIIFIGMISWCFMFLIKIVIDQIKEYFEMKKLEKEIFVKQISEEELEKCRKDQELLQKIFKELEIKFFNDFWDKHKECEYRRVVPAESYPNNWMIIYMYFEIIKKLARLEDLINSKSKSESSNN